MLTCLLTLVSKDVIRQISSFWFLWMCVLWEALTFFFFFYSGLYLEVGKATKACLQQEDSHLRGMGSGNAMQCGFGFLAEASLGHQYHSMNHLGWLQMRADGSLMAPHWTGSPPRIIQHKAFMMNPKWEAVNDLQFFLDEYTTFIF